MVDNILKYEKIPEDDYYFILGCDELSTSEQISAEFKARVLACHPDKNANNPDAAAQFAKLQRAKEVLINAETRSQYDLWRRAGVAISFEEWSSRKSFMSVHWMNAERKKPMLTEKSDETAKEKETEDTFHWNSDQSRVVRQFRSYNI